ncbi:MAG TPA: hypothetical protein VIM57_07945 [Luteolibacter sp.]
MFYFVTNYGRHFFAPALMNWKSKLVLAVVTLGGGAWLGYRAERQSGNAAVQQEPASRSSARENVTTRSRIESVDRLNALRRLVGRSSLTPKEEAECWAVIRGFSADEVKAYLAELPVDSRQPVDATLTGMLFYRWGQLDPDAAMGEARQPSYAKVPWPQRAILVAWMDRDMEGALQWAAANGPKMKSMVGGIAGRLWAIQNPETALARATTEWPSAVGSVLATLAREMSKSEESRRKFFTLLASRKDPAERTTYLGSLASTFPDSSVGLKVLAELEESGLLPEQVDFFRKQVERVGAEQHPQETLEGMLVPGSNTSKDGPLAAYGSWLARRPDEAIAWATNHGRVDFLAETVKKQTVQRIVAGWQPRPGEKDRWGGSTLSQFNAWRKHEPVEAVAWLQTLPSDIRDHFNASSDDATR